MASLQPWKPHCHAARHIRRPTVSRWYGNDTPFGWWRQWLRSKRRAVPARPGESIHAARPCLEDTTVRASQLRQLDRLCRDAVTNDAPLFNVGNAGIEKVPLHGLARAECSTPRNAVRRRAGCDRLRRLAQRCKESIYHDWLGSEARGADARRIARERAELVDGHGIHGREGHHGGLTRPPTAFAGGRGLFPECAGADPYLENEGIGSVAGIYASRLERRQSQVE